MERGGGGNGRGPGIRGFWVTCEKPVQVRVYDPKKRKYVTETQTETTRTCLKGNPHHAGNNYFRNPNAFYTDLLSAIVCPNIQRRNGAMRGGKRVRQLKYDEVYVKGNTKTGREFEQGELNDLKRSGELRIQRYGRVTYGKGVKRGRRDYLPVKYVKKNRIQQKKYRLDNYDVEWDQVSSDDCQNIF